ncbi:aryl-sulfate sulfotransferase, partial [candidate division KSB1 bacterium]
IEVNPQMEIVWEWHFWDHLSSAEGGIANGKPVSTDTTDPGKLNINFTPTLYTDWIHVNAVEYNPELDQVAISAHFLNEFYIIDHSYVNYSDTDQEIEKAAGPEGDIIYRWGNPVSYGLGTEADQKLFGIHDINWIADDCPGAGNLIFFNNGHIRPVQYSSVDEIMTPVNMNNSYDRQSSSIFGPTDPVWSYTAPVKTDFYSCFISGAQRLPNGNTLICEGFTGRFFEVTNEGEMVWEYINPVTSQGFEPQGTVIYGGNEVFRCYRYAFDFPAFEGKHLVIPNLNTEDPITSVEDGSGQPGSFLLHQNYPNPFNPATNIKFDLVRSETVNLVIFNSIGEEVKTIVNQVLTTGAHVYSWNGTDNSGSKVSSGVYFYRLSAGDQMGIKRMVYMK